MLYDLHGMDERLRTHRQGLPAADFSVFYHLMSLERNSDVMIKVALKESDLNVPTIASIWPNADWYEREVWDMYGIHFAGHPRLTRLLMPHTREGHPLRKDYPARATELDPFMLTAARQDAAPDAPPAAAPHLGRPPAAQGLPGPRHRIRSVHAYRCPAGCGTGSHALQPGRLGHEARRGT